MEGTILFPRVRGGFSENLVAEAHGLLQHLKRAQTTSQIILTKSCGERDLIFVSSRKKIKITSLLLLQAVKRSVWAAVVGEMKSSNTSKGDIRYRINAEAKNKLNCKKHLTLSD